MEKIWKIAIGVVVCASIGLAISVKMNQTQSAYVNTAELYNGFLLKNELESTMIATEKARQRVLDSLEVNIRSMKEVLQAKETQTQEELVVFDQLRQQYLMKEKQFAEDNQILASQYTNQIWTQLNQYVKDFGEERGYDYLFGANGEGQMMYAKPQRNITEELTEFVSDKYNGVE